MIWFRKHSPEIATERLNLRLPKKRDFLAWAELRTQSRDFLVKWEPTWSSDHLSRKAFSARVHWARHSASQGTGLPLLAFRKSDQRLVGGITLDHIRRGPSQSGSLGYWVGEPYARQGYMSEAITAVVQHAFTKMSLGRIEAACLPDNLASRRLLEKAGFECEGSAKGYLRINGRWRNHIVFAILRSDRLDRSNAG